MKNSTPSDTAAISEPPCVDRNYCDLWSQTVVLLIHSCYVYA